MSPLRMIYLALAILGAVWPMWHYTAWAGQNPMTLAGLLEAWTTNSAAKGLLADLTVAASALTVWIIAETWVRKNWVALLAIPATFLIGLSCGLPLYLFLRTRPVT